MRQIPKRISRLTSLLIHLQSNRVITATQLSKKFSVSIRTIYRDIRALEEAGIPVITEEGKGYSLTADYRIPPVMFTEQEALALITAEQLVLANNDTSFIQNYTDATSKIKAIMRDSALEKIYLLKERIQIRRNVKKTTSNLLSTVQLALINHQLLRINYHDAFNKVTERQIEPFALYSDGENWVLFAFCRLRGDFRAFRLDRVLQLSTLDEKFRPHNMTMPQFFEKHYNTSDS